MQGEIESTLGKILEDHIFWKIYVFLPFALRNIFFCKVAPQVEFPSSAATNNRPQVDNCRDDFRAESIFFWYSSEGSWT